MLGRIRRWIDRRPRVAVGAWAGRFGVLALFASLILTLTASFIYVFNVALLPASPLELTFRAQRQCTAAFDKETSQWNSCVLQQRRPLTEGPIRFLLPSAAGAVAGAALVVLAARFRPAAVIPSLVLIGLLAAGTAFAVREQDRTRERLRAIPITASPSPTPSPEG
ncbi:MAG TPA: hypothetical protein VGB28_02775 [Actinomycetota bacterium]|jgi:hypothetical protein